MSAWCPFLPNGVAGFGNHKPKRGRVLGAGYREGQKFKGACGQWYVRDFNGTIRKVEGSK